MKFKLIQFATLLIFVMSVVYMAPPRDGFGSIGTCHMPAFYVDGNGDNIGKNPTNPKIPVGGDDDPRWKSFSPIVCGTNGSRYVKQEGWYYRPGILNGGTSEHHTEGDNLTHARQGVFKLVLTAVASAGSTTAEASLTPSIDGINVHPTPASKRTSYQGNGKINLHIPELVYHVTMNRNYRWCNERTAEEHKLQMDNYANLYLDISVTKFTKRKNLSVSASDKTGNVSIGYSQDQGEEWEDLRETRYGIEGRVGNTFWTKYPGIDLQGKSATADGNLDGNCDVNIAASYPKAASSWCPEQSVTDKKYLPHDTPW